MTEEMRTRPDEPPRWTLTELANEIDSSTNAEGTVTGISLHSGHVVPGDLYAALPGASSHGASFAGVAKARGAVGVLTDPEGAALVTELPEIIVDDARAVIARLSSFIYGDPSSSFTTIGVTGTQGKTTTTYLAEAALGDHKSAVVGTIGTRIGKIPAPSTLTTPEAPQLQALFAVMREEAVEVCAMEVSSHALVQGRVDGFVFDVAVFLNLGRDHLDFHKDLEDYFLAKASLFTPEHAKHAVINIDDAPRQATGRAHAVAGHDLLDRRQPGRLASGQHPSAPARHRSRGARSRRCRDTRCPCRSRASSTSPTRSP